MGPFTTEPFFGERIASLAVLLGLEMDEGDGELDVELPEPHPAARRANPISADPAMWVRRSLTLLLFMALIPGKSA